MSRRLGNERGATVPEYALTVALVAAVLIVVLGSVRDKGSTKLSGEDARVGVIQDNAAYQAPGGPGGPPPPPDPPPDGGTFAGPSITQSSDPTNGDTTKPVKNLWTGSYRILITSSTGDPVSGVTVGYRWNGTGAPQTCTTTGTGECLIGDTFADDSSSVTIKVTDLTKSNWTVPVGTLPVTSGVFSCSPPLTSSCD